MPRAIDKYIASDDPARAYDVFIGALDLEKLGITRLHPSTVYISQINKIFIIM
jgi:hypothetical protein